MDEITQKVVDGTAWSEFCDLLRDAGEAVLSEGNPSDPLDRAEGFRMLTRLLRCALESKLEYGRPTQPQLICTCHETMKIVGENPDNHYLGTSLDGAYDYRIWGTRGDAKWISFNLFSGGGFGGGGPGVGATLHEEQMQIGPDGSFELIISQREYAGNWLPSEVDTRSLAIRQTFLDRRHQRHAEMHIERLDSGNTPPDPLTPEELYLSLLYAGFYVKRVAEIGAQWATRQSKWPNVFTDEAERPETDKFKDPQIKWHQAYFELGDDEALVVEFTPPDCEYWMIALHNHWMETLDYVHHQATLNCHSAQREADGSVRFVIARNDPGLPNWLDTAGHQRGTIGVRWVGPHVVDILPSTRVVKVDSL
ncbi:MAG TPA: DUF1214 domain-containing protein [Acidimicrobiales bacterium]|jgi:hypothetical protein|nr:DUF1214 domain-containing protein [Acidimicrobiales bacterium]